MPAPIVARVRVSVHTEAIPRQINAANQRFFTQVRALAGTLQGMVVRKLSQGIIPDSPRTSESGKLVYARRPDRSPVGSTDVNTPTLFQHARSKRLVGSVRAEVGGLSGVGGSSGGVSVRVRLGPEATNARGVLYGVFHESLAPRTKIPYRPFASPVAAWADGEVRRIAYDVYRNAFPASPFQIGSKTGMWSPFHGTSNLVGTRQVPEWSNLGMASLRPPSSVSGLWSE